MVGCLAVGCWLSLLCPLLGGFGEREAANSTCCQLRFLLEIRRSYLVPPLFGYVGGGWKLVVAMLWLRLCVGGLVVEPLERKLKKYCFLKVLGGNRSEEQGRPAITANHPLTGLPVLCFLIFWSKVSFSSKRELNFRIYDFDVVPKG